MENTYRKRSQAMACLPQGGVVCKREVAGRWPETLTLVSIDWWECKKHMGIQRGDGSPARGVCVGEIINGDGPSPCNFSHTRQPPWGRRAIPWLRFLYVVFQSFLSGNCQKQIWLISIPIEYLSYPPQGQAGNALSDFL